ncbi:DUF6431 domain-containing protein [Streptomyces mirabilis]|uniref:DUF6431 domain-containing protein n=1 Tax=Streptomyces mirabilis TaxID=68239 RepID=UPI00364BC6EA
MERQLQAAQLNCPSCSAVLTPWGHGRSREVRGDLGARLFVRPRRSRCSGCGITHVLLPETIWPRRADAAEVIGAGLEIAALGMGHRQVAAHLGRAEDTVRGWIRRFKGRSEDVRRYFTVALVALADDPDALGLLLGGEVPGVGLAPASGEQFGEHAAQLGEVAAAGAQQGEVVVDGPGGEDPGAGQVEADGVDPVLVGGIEQQVAGQLPGGALGHLRQRPTGTLEVEQQAVDDDVGVGGDLGAGERRPSDAVPGPGASAQGLKGTVGGLVELGGDVGHQVAVRELQQPREREGGGVLEGGLGERGVGEADRRTGEDLVPGRGDQHAGQVLLFVLAAVDGQFAVVEVQAVHGLRQAHRELVADGAHSQASATAADLAGELDPDQGGVVDGCGRGEGQAQPLVDCRAEGAGLGADAGRGEQKVVGTVLGA